MIIFHKTHLAIMLSKTFYICITEISKCVDIMTTMLTFKWKYILKDAFLWTNISSEYFAWIILSPTSSSENVQTVSSISKYILFHGAAMAGI